jgi:uncharacterized protein with PIN domain
MATSWVWLGRKREFRTGWRPEATQSSAILQIRDGRAVKLAARLGRLRHPAQLNLGDCFAYAQAKSSRAAFP